MSYFSMAYALVTQTWNSSHQSRINTVEISYLRGAYGLTRWNEESNESVKERYGMVWVRGQMVLLVG